LTDALPIVLAAASAVATTVLTKTLSPENAFTGCTAGFILLIFLAFRVVLERRGFCCSTGEKRRARRAEEVLPRKFSRRGA
jgi:hypothetical protein